MDGLITEETQVKETKKEPLKEGVEWISECIDLKQLFGIKGRPGLYIPATRPNRSGLVRMQRLLSMEAYTVNQILLQALDGTVIFKDDMSTIGLAEAFDNLQKHCNNELHSGNIDGLIMHVICPDYDIDKFKLYHAKKVIQWYNEIVQAIKEPYSELEP